MAEPFPSACDLLHHAPLRRCDEPRAAEALAFAFAGGDGDVFANLLEQPPVAASSFEPGDFRQNLFLDVFVGKCLPVHIGGKRRDISQAHLVGLLCAPPDDARHMEFRQAILRELCESPRLRKHLEELYLWTWQFRDLLSRSCVGAQEGVARRLSILTSVRSIVDSLVHGFGDCRSGLSRLGQFGRRIAADAGFQRLTELLDYEKNRAEVDVRLSVGFDGRIRSFQAIERRPNRSNAFYSSQLGRFWTSLCLMFAGYRASSGEVLSRLLDGVFSGLEPQLVQLFPLIGDLEFYLAALNFRDHAASVGQETCLPEVANSGSRQLVGLFNPWLTREEGGCRPCTLNFDQNERLVFLTGPNSGGKTRLLQSISLCQLLAQCGFFVPARSARLVRVPGLFASLTEQPSADQKEGRLGTELLRIRRLFQHLRAGSMVVVDELCSGTNPSEGETLMSLVLDVLVQLRPQAFVATHFLDFTAELRAGELEGSMPPGRTRHRYLQAELDKQERPTYRFIEGVAGTSLAHRVAERLGVTRESLQALLRKNNPEL